MRGLLALLAVAASASLGAQTSPDTVRVTASDVVAVRAVVPVFATVHRMDSVAIRGVGTVDLAAALNQIPGVKMETRGAGGSRRLRMRGSSLRSPFGVRNVFFLLDGFAMTWADGESPVEWLDPELLSGIEVMTGPSGAALGGGYAGAIWAHSHTGHTGGVARLGTVGALPEGGTAPMGMLAAHGHSGPFAASVLAAHNAGYRDQEANGKWQGDLHWRSTGSAGQARHAWLGVYDGWWELPGSLDLSTSESRPTEAPGAPFGARVERKRVALGWSTTRPGTPEQGLWVLAHATDKHNPYGTSAFFNGEKFERGGGMSARWARQGALRETDRARWSWHSQAIAQLDRLALEDREWNGPASRYDLSSTSARGWATAGVRRVGASGFALHAGAACDGAWRRTGGVVRASEDFAESFEAGALLYRGGLAFPLASGFSAFAEVGTGVSTPTSFELVDPETLNAYDLRSEWGRSLELGVQHRRASVAVFEQQVRDAISIVPGPTDVPVLANADVLVMRGAEAIASGTFDRQRGGYRVWGCLSRYSVDAMGSGERFAMPGTPLHAFGGAVTWRQGKGRMEVRHRWNDRAPLNNAGTDWAPAHHRIDAAMGCTLGPWDVQLSALNASNSRYSDWYQVNAFGGKYYNPVGPLRWELTVRWAPVNR